ncbi:hypothetical protein SAMN04488005_1064 [Yoonia tamlensis]|uniref:Uncharacterized protein n=1 Tax=Yoonia tamlensis TaxID=390270 RepID=A0A1I6G4I2_9RHOB|nr:hypothetical protein [Yoonia tamlensis]SFR37072.1 hypothetical protein SAMN04488005_1064 [Yoonia tamlensis]
MIDYIQDIITTAFDFDGTDRLARRYAFAQLMIGGVIIVAVPFRILMSVADGIRNRRARAALLDELTRDIPAGATAAQVKDLLPLQQVNRRRAYTAPLLPPIALATAPADGSYFMTLRQFAQEKSRSGAAMNTYEREAMGPVAYIHDCFGTGGFGQFDGYTQTPPYKTHELRAIMGQLGLSEMANAVESANALHLQRYQLFQDFTATGMPAAQAKAHPDMPDYTPLDNAIAVAGGQARLLRAADRYFQAAYPWLENDTDSAVLPL